MYKGIRYFRTRSVDNVIRDLKKIKDNFASCGKIWFNEADFLAGKSQEYIEDFSGRYKAEVGIPFGIWSDPNCVNKDNIGSLKNAGLLWINIGTVNANENIQKGVYNRVATADRYISSARILHENGLKIEYDFILCNPYENDDDIINTIKLIISFPKPFRTVIYSLAYFKGTALYKKALADGVIKEDDDPQSYTKAAYKAWRFRGRSAYLNTVASTMRGTASMTRFGFVRYGYMPEPVLRFLIKRPAVAFFNRLPFRTAIFTVIGNLIEYFYNIAVRLHK